MLYKNKKGVEIFLPIFVIVTFFILGITAYSINKANINLGIEAPIGDSTAKIFMIYDEAEKAQLYIEQSSKLAKQESLKKLADNGGTSERNECKKSKPPTIGITKEYVLLNTCKTYDPKESFTEILNLTLSNHLKNYQTTLVFLQAPTAIETFLAPSSYKGSEDELLDVDLMYAESVRKNTIVSFENQIIEFKPIKYVIPRNFEISGNHEFTPKVKLPPIDFSKYNTLFQALFICNGLKDCENRVNSKFSDAEIAVFNEIMYLKIKSDYDIYIALDTSEKLVSVG